MFDLHFKPISPFKSRDLKGEMTVDYQQTAENIVTIIDNHDVICIIIDNISIIY